MADLYIFRWRESHKGIKFCQSPEEAERIQAELEQDGPEALFDADRTREGWDVLSVKVMKGGNDG